MLSAELATALTIARSTERTLPLGLLPVQLRPVLAVVARAYASQGVNPTRYARWYLFIWLTSRRLVVCEPAGRVGRI